MALLAGSPVAHAQPVNPSDDELDASRQSVTEKADKVGELTNQLSELESQLTTLSAQVQVKMQQANKARVDLSAAQQAAKQAEQKAETSRAAVASAMRKVEENRKRLDEFAASSYRNGSVVGSVTELFGTGSPRELLDRSNYLNSVGGSGLETLDQMRRANTEAVNRESLAREALAVANAKRAEADRAKQAADSARNSAIQAQRQQQGQVAAINNAKENVQQQLAAAQSNVHGLQSQRQRYQQWASEKAAQDAAAAQQAAAQRAPVEQAPPQVSAVPQSGSVQQYNPVPQSAPVSAGGGVEAVIGRAMSTMGTPYAWGGGDVSGPTSGIRDGGVADMNGDYAKVGFDCSGLMTYAFAAAGLSLPSYTGYQYAAGTKVPLSSMQRGDMLFWTTGGQTHHVALYLGNGQMIEAPYSGSSVKVSPVRYQGIAPYAVRVL